MSTRVAVVTGSNKGIGFSIVKGLCERFDGVVYLTSRDEARGRAAVAELNKLGLHPRYLRLDVADEDSVAAFRDHIKEAFGGLDILVNNAAVADAVALYGSHEANKQIVDTNYKSILTIQQLIFPLVRDNGRILNISSDCGHLSNLKNKVWLDKFCSKNFTLDDVNQFVEWYLQCSENGNLDKDEFADNSTLAAYRVSKIALSAATILQQKELESRNISVNSMHPGLVRTDMTGGVGFYSADEAAERPLQLLLHAPATLRGCYVWFDGRVLDWFDHNADYYFKSSTLKR